MKKIYTGIDIGSYSIKIVVSEVVGGKFHTLAASNTRCRGIKKGLIVDMEEATTYLQKAKQKVEDMLGISIDQAVVTTPSNDREFDIVEGKVKIETEDKTVTSNEISAVLQDAILGRVKDSRELISITPISFKIDAQSAVKDPKGLTGKVLSVRAVITTIPKTTFKETVALLKNCGIEAVDVTLGAIGDYYEAKTPDTEKTVSAIINIGYSKTEISIYNKGILIRNDIMDMGSRLVDRDLMYMYKIKKGQAISLKENFAVSNTRYSNINDKVEITNKLGETYLINQLEVSEIVEARIIGLLKDAKKQINILTNREISYIIITGGISELAGFEYVVENVFDRRTSTLNIGTIGIRSNMYSSAFGIIKYFHNKLNLRGLSYSMVNERESESLISTKEKLPSGLKDSIISKVFGYFSGE